MPEMKNCLVHYKSDGFTLIELMVTIGIFAIAAAISIPSYRYLIASNRIAKEADDLHGSIELARSYAQKTGMPVIVCPRNDNATACLDTNDWSKGWLVATATNGCGNSSVSTSPLNVSGKVTGNDLVIFNRVSATKDTWLCINRLGVLSDKYNGMFIFDVAGASSNHPNMRCLAAHTTGQTSLIHFNQIDSVSGQTCKSI